MKIICAKDYSDLSRKAANIISAQVILKPESVLGLATGSSPLGVYRQLILWYEKGDLDFAEATSVNLDEYRGLSANNTQSYHYFMHKNFFDYINIAPDHIHIPDGMAADPDAECRRYDRLIADLGGIDLQLLGIGRNAHIGFNEPDDHFSKYTHQVDLTESTIAANTRFFEREEDVPRQAISMGMQAITQARKILLIASGADKADAIYASCFGPVTPGIPASILQLHQDVTVIADKDALSKCPQQAWAQKAHEQRNPHWVSFQISSKVFLQIVCPCPPASALLVIFEP